MPLTLSASNAIRPDSEAVASRLGQVISFVSAKGGSGKTLLTATAAYLLTKSGKNVVVIDTDFSTRGLTLFLLGGKEARSRKLDVEPKNCLSDALFANLSEEEIQPRKIPRPEFSFNLILSSMQSWTTNMPDDRIVGEAGSDSIASSSSYFLFLDRLLNRFRKTYDYVLIDTRGGYDFSSAAPALLADGYVVVLEADQISVQQVYGLKERIEEWGVRHSLRPALSGFIVNKATFTLEDRSFSDTLVNLYGGAHFGTIPLDIEAVRAYQVREIPTELRPDSDFAFHSYNALERLFSPSLNWEPVQRVSFDKLGEQIKTLWRARRSWQVLERALPAIVLVLALITGFSYIYLRSSNAPAAATIFFLSSAAFVLTSTFISLFILLKSFQSWRISRFFRKLLAAYGITAALVLFWLTLVDVRHTFSKDVLIGRIEDQNRTISEQANRLSVLSAAAADAERRLQFANDDKSRAQSELKAVQDQLNQANSKISDLNSRLSAMQEGQTQIQQTPPQFDCLSGTWWETDPKTHQQKNQYVWRFLQKGTELLASRNDGIWADFRLIGKNQWGGSLSNGKEIRNITLAVQDCNTVKADADFWFTRVRTAQK